MFIDIPLLFENKLEKIFDVVLCVIAKKKIRRERVLKNKKFTKNILEKSLNLKSSDGERKENQTYLFITTLQKKTLFFH